MRVVASIFGVRANITRRLSVVALLLRLLFLLVLGQLPLVKLPLRFRKQFGLFEIRLDYIVGEGETRRIRIPERAVIRNGRSHDYLNSNYLENIPEDAWEPQLNGTVYRGFPQAIDLQDTISRSISQRLITELTGFSQVERNDPPPPSKFTKYFPVEDAWLGLVANRLNITARNIHEFIEGKNMLIEGRSAFEPIDAKIFNSLALHMWMAGAYLNGNRFFPIDSELESSTMNESSLESSRLSDRSSSASNSLLWDINLHSHFTRFRLCITLSCELVSSESASNNSSRN
nr:hypothetical protein HmN_000929500 [Hymenolepis microstoma]